MRINKSLLTLTFLKIFTYCYALNQTKQFRFSLFLNNFIYENRTRIPTAPESPKRVVLWYALLGYIVGKKTEKTKFILAINHRIVLKFILFYLIFRSS